VTSYLITTPQGHILLDGGFPETAAQIQRNVEALGFKLRDIRYIITSHAHYDHVGGVAELKRVTGAKLVTSADDAALLARGGKNDFAFADRLAYPAVTADQTIRHGGRLKLGGTTLKAHFTPGHTKGCITWEMTAREGGRSYNVVFVGSASVPGYRLVDNENYPGIVKDYETTFARLAALQPDVFLSAHGSQFNLEEKMKARATSAANPFIDPAGYRAYVRSAREAFRSNLARQRAERASTK
ncbi:MAG TPA: subclass B3 metallo-beta-lactamase, partial [Thermoanaerobaculia bacterium]|jgi:metallo-beta-lactamase class B